MKDDNMGRVFSYITRVTATAVFLLLANTTPTIHASAPVGQAFATSAYLFPEARLRKVHLVRPDLLPYPIVYAVYC